MPILATQNAAAADNWQARNISGTPPVPPPPAGARTVATTLNGLAAAYTDDGATWTLTTLPVNVSWVSVVYGANTFVVIDRATSVARSTDYGVTWNVITVPVNRFWTAVTYGANTFVAVSESSKFGSTTAVTSPDGVTWTRRTLPVSADWRSVTYGAGTFVAVAYNSTIAATSPDGVTWTSRTLPVNALWQQVLYLQDRFLAFARPGETAVSTDQGATWTSSTTLPALPAAHGWEDAAFSPTLGSGQGRLVVVEGFSTDSDIVAYSDDQGQTWTETTTPIPEDMSGVTWNGSAFIVVCSDTDVAFTSPDGITWTQRTMPATTGWGPIASAV